MDFATCSYGEFKPEMGNPVRITLGRSPAWFVKKWSGPLPVITGLAPHGSYFRAPLEEFRAKYAAQLERHGIEQVAEWLGQAAVQHQDPARPLVLLCFEKSSTHAEGWDSCHRSMLRQWWEQKTNLLPPELGAHPEDDGELPPTLDVDV
jgi:hypothetical protein